MEAGRLKHRVQFYALPETPIRNEFGEEILQDVAIHECWAAIEPMAGREYFSAIQVSADITHRVRIRYSPKVAVEQTLIFGERRFNVLSVRTLLEERREMEIIAKEILA